MSTLTVEQEHTLERIHQHFPKTWFGPQDVRSTTAKLLELAKAGYLEGSKNGAFVHFKIKERYVPDDGPREDSHSMR